MKQRILGLVLLAGVLVNIGCDGSSTASNVATTPSTPTPLTPGVTANMCTSPTTRIIAYGERATAGATMGLRGAFSDVAHIPGTNYPGMAYTDTGAVALKYTFWDGTTFRTEVIAGGLTTNFVRLVYLSTGKPLVFWANGATGVFMASRSTASTSATGTWTVTAIDNVATMTTRAVEASVSATDQVAVFYISAIGTVARLVLCSANCDSAANYTGMGAIGNGISVVASATTNSADVKWCNAGAGVNYPYVTFGGSVNALIARCNNATLANCLVPGNWASAAITDGVNATGANQPMAKLHIDSTVDAPFQVVSRRATGNEIRAYAQNAGGCATGALTFSATSRLIATGATLATAYGSLVRDSSNRWHLAINDAATNIRYYNELTGTITAAWNTTANVETTTIGAVGATRGGLAVDTAGDQVLLTYGRTAAGTPAQTLGNLVLAYNNCATGGTGCLASTLASPSSAAGMTWGNMPVDTTGQIKLPTAQIPNTLAVAATSTGIPGAVYTDFSVGSATTGRLKYALRAGSLATDAWPAQILGSALSPQSVALAYDHNDQPWIAYYDAAAFRYYLATNYRTDGSGFWMTYSFPIAAAAAPTLPAANNVALAMSYSGGVAKPLMIVTNSGAATKVMRAALFNPTTENWTLNTQLDTGVANFSHVSADYDTNGNIVVAYFDTTNSAVKFNYSANGGTTWGTASTVITTAGGTGVNVRLNPVTGRPAVTFFDRANNLVRYKYCNTALASCTTAASWVNLGLGLVDASAGVSGLSAAATDGLLTSSLSFDSDGYAWVAYPTGAGATSADLNFAYVSTTTGVFTTPAAMNAGSNGSVTTPVASTAANFAAGGWMPASVRTSTGSLHTVYVGPGNALYATSCGN